MCDCKNCKNTRNECEWFEIGVVVKRDEYGDIEETKTVYQCNTYEEALEQREKLQRENPHNYYFIDGWIDSNNPKDIWMEGE